MVLKLSEQEIKLRLQRLRNLERFYVELKEKYQKLKEENTMLKEIIKGQAEQIEMLKLRIEELETMVFGRSKKAKKGDENNDDSPTPKKPRSKPNRNAASYRRPKPADDEITDTEHHALSNCSDCGAALTRIKIVERWVEDMLPLSEWYKALKKVIKHSITTGYCPKCQERKAAIPIAPQTVSVGDNVKQFVCFATVVLRLSYEQISDFLQGTARFNLSDGEITNIMAEHSISLHQEFAALKTRIRGQPGAHYDESTWPVQQSEQGNHVWVQTGTETADALFLFGRSRGKGNAEELRGNELNAQVAITDDYGAYKNPFAKHQLCWAHPHRKLRDLKDSEKLCDTKKQHCQEVYEQFKELYADVRTTIEEPFDLKQREQKKEKFIKQFDEITVPHPNDPRKLTAIKKRLRERKTAYFTCITEEGIPCDNNKAERHLRHIVLKRKNSFGSKTQAGADMASVIYSVLLSLWWKSKETFFQEYAARLAENR